MKRSILLQILIAFFVLSLLSSNLLAASESLENQFTNAIAFFKAKSDREAEILFLKILEKDPSQVRPRQFLGLIYTRSKRLDEASIMFEEIMVINPKHWGGPYGLGLVQQQQKLFEEAKVSFKQAVVLSPKNPQVWFRLAEIARSQNNQEALVVANQMILKFSAKGSQAARLAEDFLKEMGGNFATASRVASLLTEAEAFRTKGELDAALAAYEEAALLVPDGAKIRHSIGTVASQVGDLARAETAFEEAILLRPDYIAAHYSLGKFYELTGRLDAAMTSYEMILSISHDETNALVSTAKETLFALQDSEEVQKLLFEAQKFINKQKFQEAQAAYKAALKIQPENGLIYYQLAHFYHLIEKNELAQKVILKARRVDPDSKALHLLSAGVFMKQRYYRKAMGAYLKVMSLLREDETNILYRKAFSGNIQAAVLYLKAKGEIKRPYVEGLTFKRRRKYKKALTQFLTAMSLLPENVVLAHAVGDIYLEVGEEAQAYLQFKRAIDLYGGYYVAHLDLARLALRQGRFYTAINSYQRLLKLNRDALVALNLSPPSLKKEFFEAVMQWQAVRQNNRLLFRQGIAAISQGNYADGIALLRSTRDQEPENKSLLFSLGIAYAAGQNWEAAQKEFQDLLDLDGRYPGALLRLAAVQEQGGQLQEAKNSYEDLIAEAIGKPEAQQRLKERLDVLKERIKAKRIASRHEKRGIAVLVEEYPDAKMYETAIWELQRGVEIAPKEASYYYNLGLVQEKSIFRKEGFTAALAKKVWYDPHFLDAPINAYESALRINSNYLLAYNRLARLYGALSEDHKAIAVYKRGLALGFSSNIQEIKDMEQGLAALEKRFSATMDITTTRDSNLVRGNTARDDVFNSLSLNLRYIVYDRPYLEVPLSYTQSTTTYFNGQTFSSLHGVGVGLEKGLLPVLKYRISARYSTNLQEAIGLQSSTLLGTTSLSYTGIFPNSATINYSFASVSFENSSVLDRSEHDISLSMNQNFLTSYAVTLSHRFTLRDTPKAPGFNAEGYRTNLFLQKRLESGTLVRLSGAIFFELFNDVPSVDNSPFSSLQARRDFITSGGILSRKYRKNFLYSYGVGLTIPWTVGVSLRFDYLYEQNESNLGANLGRDSSVEREVGGTAGPTGNYFKRVWSFGVSFAF